MKNAIGNSGRHLDLVIALLVVSVPLVVSLRGRPVTAQTNAQHGQTPAPAGAGAVDRDLMAALTKMDRDMTSVEMTGDPDRDFTVMMIPHHQAAIEMARVELLYGKDPVIRRLAQEIIVDQQSEIDVMKLWLAKQANGRPSGPSAKPH
jgi:uncharacterized protein (DUF305 family)